MGVKTSFSNLCNVLKMLLSKKVDKVSGKGLSTNDFTNDLKTKLDSGVYTKTDIDNKYFMTGLRGTTLPENTDLNNVKSPGVYCISSGSVAKTCLNTPGSLIANCRLEVFFSTGVPANNNYLIQQLYQNTAGSLYVWVRSMTAAGHWSPWHLMNGNDFTNYNYEYNNVTDKYIKLATYNIEDTRYIDAEMVFNIYSNLGDNYTWPNDVGILRCHLRIGNDLTKPEGILAIWISKGTSINTKRWFVTYNSTTKEFILWKKITAKYESYTVQLISSSNRGSVGNTHNNVTMYYIKSTADTYTAADYVSIVTSTTCDSTSVNLLDFGNAIATNCIDISQIPSATAYGITRTINGYGYISYVGTNALKTDYDLVLMNSRTLTAGTYRFTHNGVAKSGSVPTNYKLYKDGKYFKGFDPSQPLIIDADGTYGICAAIQKGATINITYRPMLERGNLAHDYVMYTGGTGFLNGDLANAVNGTTWNTISVNSSVGTGTIYYRKICNIISMYCNDLTIANSYNASHAVIVTVPQSCRPLANSRYAPCEINGNLASEIRLSISTDGTMAINRSLEALPKGIPIVFNIVYMR